MRLCHRLFFVASCEEGKHRPLPRLLYLLIDEEEKRKIIWIHNETYICVIGVTGVEDSFIMNPTQMYVCTYIKHRVGGRKGGIRGRQHIHHNNHNCGHHNNRQRNRR